MNATHEPYKLHNTPTGALLVVSADGQAVASEQAMAVLEALRNKAVLELEHYSLELEHLEEGRFYRLCAELYPNEDVLPGSGEEGHVLGALLTEGVQRLSEIEKEIEEQGFYEPFDEGDAIERAYERQGAQHALEEVKARVKVLTALHDYAQDFSLENISYGAFYIKHGCVKLEIEAGGEK